MTIKEMNRKRTELGYSYEQLAHLAYLPVETVQDTLEGRIKSPEYSVLDILEEVFEEKALPLVAEMPAYMYEKRQGEYTIEDYFAIPDDQRVELIDGVLYDMAAPSTIHQYFCDEIQTLFREYIRKKAGNCIAMTSPVDVQLDCDDKTMLQPDVIIVCNRDKFKFKRVFGEPELVVEILSPSTGKRDLTIKKMKYQKAGVKEYWIVDPQKKRVMVYEFSKNEVATIYTFDDKVPIGIFSGECKINFKEIYEYGRFLFNPVL